MDLPAFVNALASGAFSPDAARLARATLAQVSFDSYVAAQEAVGRDTSAARSLTWIDRVRFLQAELRDLQEKLTGNDPENRAQQFGLFAGPKTAASAEQAVADLSVLLPLLDACIAEGIGS